MMYLLYQTFKKKTEFLKINKKAAENLSEDSEEIEDNIEIEKAKSEKKLEKIEEQEESEFEEEDSIDFSKITNKPEMPLQNLNDSQFEKNSLYEHVRSHYDKNSNKIFRVKGLKKKSKKEKTNNKEEK